MTFQGTYNTVRYRVIGDDAAPGFFSVEAESGEVKVAGDVQADTETQYKVNICYFCTVFLVFRV